MKLINIRKAVAGDVLAYNIMTESGQIMLRDGKALTGDMIRKIRNLGINYIYIKNHLVDDIEPISPEFVKLKTEVVKSFNNMYNRIQNNSIAQIDDINGSVRSLVDFIVTNEDMNTVYLSDLKSFDNYTFIHSLNTALNSLFIGNKMNLARENLVELTLGALLHDIGKTKVPKKVLNKAGKLTKEEFDIMKKHPKYGHDIIFKMPSVSPQARLISLQHHEKINSEGYPRGLYKEDITLYSRIVAVSDVYDAISNNRVYRNAMESKEAYDIILNNAGTHFDPRVVDVFKREISIYPIGTEVEVTGGMVGYVVRQNRGKPSEPVIRLAYNPIGEKLAYPIEVDLLVSKEIRVIRATV